MTWSVPEASAVAVAGVAIVVGGAVGSMLPVPVERCVVLVDPL